MDGTKTLLCQLCVGCLLTPRMIVCKNGACKDRTCNNDTNGKVGKNGSFSILGMKNCMGWGLGPQDGGFGGLGF